MCVKQTYHQETNLGHISAQHPQTTFWNWDIIIMTTKEIDDPKMEILLLITHPHVVPNPKDFHSSSEHK